MSVGFDINSLSGLDSLDVLLDYCLDNNLVSPDFHSTPVTPWTAREHRRYRAFLNVPISGNRSLYIWSYSGNYQYHTDIGFPNSRSGRADLPISFSKICLY